LTINAKRNHYNIKLLRGYGVSISLKDNKIILKEIGMDGSAIIFHPFRFNKKIRYWYYSPHFHVVGFGLVKGIVDSYYKNYWYIKDVGVRKSVFESLFSLKLTTVIIIVVLPSLYA